MKWVVDKLSESDTVTFRPKGNSMHPLVKNGQEVTLRKFSGNYVPPGSVVLCKVKGRIYLHKVVGVRSTKNQEDHKVWEYQIGNNRGRVNGWTRIIYGVMENV